MSSRFKDSKKKTSSKEIKTATDIIKKNLNIPQKEATSIVKKLDKERIKEQLDFLYPEGEDIYEMTLGPNKKKTPIFNPISETPSKKKKKSKDEEEAIDIIQDELKVNKKVASLILNDVFKDILSGFRDLIREEIKSVGISPSSREGKQLVQEIVEDMLPPPPTPPAPPNIDFLPPPPPPGMSKDEKEAFKKEQAERKRIIEEKRAYEAQKKKEQEKLASHKDALAEAVAKRKKKIEEEEKKAREQNG